MGLFNTYFMGGFECSTKRRNDGTRLDLLAATRHDRYACEDYQALQSHGVGTVRDGIRWHLIEQKPKHYDWGSFLPMLRAAQITQTQVIWDLCHYGVPDHIDIWSTRFPDQFARFAAEVARVVRDETDTTPFYCPVNEISFWAWAGGDMELFDPCTTRRGMELKKQLVRAAIMAIHAIRDVDARARMVLVDPVIHVTTRSAHLRAEAAHAQNAQYEAWDMLQGSVHPELGGSADCLDIVGVNFYSDNQWFLRGPTIKPDHPLYRPFRDMLAETFARYQRPMIVAETGAEGDLRAPWLRYVCDEVWAATQNGVPVEGLCIYPITDYPGWVDQRHCPCGLLGPADEAGAREIYTPLAEELACQQQRFSSIHDDVRELANAALSSNEQ